MISLLHSGKFWLKLMVFSCLGIFLLLAIDMAVLHYLFNAEEINKRANALVSDSGRQVVFDSDISRSMFPRPTVTLHQVRILNKATKSDDINIGSMRIGLSWQSLFGRLTIEKLQLANAHINLIRNNQDQWNLTDLWQKSRKSDRLQVNRLILDNASFRIHDGINLQQINQLNLKWHNLGSTSLLQLNGTLSGEDMQPLQYQLSAVYHPDAVMQWQDVKLGVKTNLSALGDSDGQWHFDARWLPQQQLLKTAAVQWQWHSQRNQLHITGNGQNWQLGWNKLLLPQLNGVATAQIGDNSINATLSASNSSWLQNHWTLPQFQIDSGWQNHLYQTALTLSGQLSWLDMRHWKIDNFSVNSHQDAVNALPNSRFISDLSGTIQGDNAGNGHLNLQGQFDNQPINIAIDYQNDEHLGKISGNIHLAQLNLRPYIDHTPSLLPADWQQLWRNWFKNCLVNTQLSIDSVLTPTVQLSQIKTQLAIDAHAFILQPISLQIYGGSSNGMLQVSNTNPLTWKVQQRASRVQMKSFLQDTFGLHNLAGEGDADFDFHGVGFTRQQWLSSLTGQAHILIRQGVWNGIDINNILQNSDSQTTVAYNETNHTPFRFIRLAIPLNNGYTKNSRIELHADNFDIKGTGNIKWLQQQMDYNVLIATRRAKQQNLLPLRINGTFTRPSFTIDYQRLTAGLHTSQQKQDSLRQTLQQQWLWLNQGSSASSENHEYTHQP
jgi:uncharacterized protein involved in outer membrane biogenesis